MLVAQQSYEPSVVRTFSSRELQQAYDTIRASPTRHEAHAGYDALIDDLRRGKATVQARLLEFMSGRDHADVSDVAEHVHGDRDTSDGAMRSNLNRVNRALESRGVPIRFKLASGRVYVEATQK